MGTSVKITVDNESRRENDPYSKEGTAMKKFWKIFGWGITIVLQIGLSFLILEQLRNWIVPTWVTNLSTYSIIPLSIWVSFLIGVYGVGILSMAIRKIMPLQAGLRLVSTAALALIPLIVLTFLGLTVGFDDPAEFREIVIGRMVPYYTNLNVAFSFLGFYIPTWFKFVKAQKEKEAKGKI